MSSSEIDKLFAKASFISSEETSSSEHITATTKGDTFFPTNSSLLPPPGLSPINKNPSQSSSKFASPPPGFPPPNNATIFNRIESMIKSSQKTQLGETSSNEKRPLWLMTDREVRHIWRISMTPVISTLCKSQVGDNLTDLYLSKEGIIEYPEDYSGGDYYFAHFKCKTPVSKLAGSLLIPSISRPGRKVAVISNDTHLKSILPHVPKLTNRSERIVDGALGKISLNSLWRPKKSIAIDVDSIPIHLSPTAKSYSRLSSLSTAEKIYQAISAKDELFILSTISDPQAVLSLIQTPKGKRTIPLIIAFLSSPALLSLFSTILCNLPLFVCPADISPLHTNYLSDDDMATVESILAPFVSFLSQLSITEMFNLCEKIAFQPGLPQIISSSKVEHLLQNDKSETMSSFENLWNKTSECLFSSLSSSFLKMICRPLQSDDDLFYAWQFLALLSIHISSDSCHSLVNILREPILSMANSEVPECIRNINLFLNMLGLDASQLAHQ